MEKPQDIPSRRDFEANGGKGEEYDAFVTKLQADHAAYAKAEATRLATKMVRVRVIGRWPAGQTHYNVPGKAPFDIRLRPGEEGFEMPYKPEPAIPLPIGKVSAVPVRDGRHEKLLRDDVNLEFVGDDVPTHAEEKADLEAFLAARKANGAAKVEKLAESPQIDPNSEIVPKADLEAMRQHISDLEKGRAEIVRANEEGSAELTKTRAQVDDLRKQLAEAAAKLTASEKMLTETQAAVEAAKKQVAELQAQIQKPQRQR